MAAEVRISYRLHDYQYRLPSALIAQTPSQERETCRLLVLRRGNDRLVHHRFSHILEYLRAGDVLVVNDTKVVPARLVGRKETGGRVELLVLDPCKNSAIAAEEGFTCLIKAKKRLLPGALIRFEEGIQATYLGSLEHGKARVSFSSSEPVLDVLNRIGAVPLPPYIARVNGQPSDEMDDAAAYQTVYARKCGAVAAPTAGLHFSFSLLEELARLGVELVKLTLHVGHGTFAPIRAQDIRDHRMHAEYVEILPDSADRVRVAKKEGRRIVAVGTTVVRTLEWVASQCGEVTGYSGFCDHYIYPGYEFRVTDALITNFHLPGSTLLLLVSALAGRERILGAYAAAIEEGYRFYSYGDAMMIL